MTLPLAATLIDSSGMRIERVSRSTGIAKYARDAYAIAFGSTAVASMTRYISDRFASNLKAWREETLFTSMYDEIISHPDYRAIVALGKAAIPLIIEDMRNGGGFWTEALTEITGADPVPNGAEGDNERIVASWEDWYSTRRQ